MLMITLLEISRFTGWLLYFVYFPLFSDLLEAHNTRLIGFVSQVGVQQLHLRVDQFPYIFRVLEPSYLA